MPKERVLKLFFAFPSYGGNGGIASEHPDIREWFANVVVAVMKDERIDPNIVIRTYNDTPATMVRNRMVLDARKEGCDVLVMVDSDQKPDCELGYDPEAKPWFPTSFDFIYKHWDKGPSVVCAPYCGPPPNECVYVFHWATSETDGENTTTKMEMYSRETAAVMTGIQPCAAQPTGLIMFDMRAFDLTDPKKLGTKDGWFYYEWDDCYAAGKASTEDVTATRDISMHGLLELGYSPIYCNWDAWAGHYKPKCVRKPRVIFADQVGEKYRNAVLRNAQTNKRRMWLGANTAPATPTVTHYHIPESVKPRQDDVERIDGMFTPANDLDVLEKLAAEVAKSTRYRPMFLEVGSWVGESALAMLRGAPDAHVTCVDTWEGTAGDASGDAAKAVGGDAVFKMFKRNTAGKSVGINLGKSVEVAKSWGPSATPRDLIFIDAEHTYEALKADIEAWWPHLKDGGVMAFHDYKTAAFPGVTQAIEERFGDAVQWDGPATTVCWVIKDAKAT